MPVRVVPPVAEIRPAPTKHRFKLPSLHGWGGPILFFAALGLLVYSVRIGTVTGGSMEPTLHEGEHIVADALTWHMGGINRGDIIIFTNPHDKTMVEVKRIVGLPNELVEAQGGIVSVTNKDGKYTEFAKDTPVGGDGTTGDFKVQLGPEDYYVLGDNRSHSTDSRDFGAVQASDIHGRVVGSF